MDSHHAGAVAVLAVLDLGAGLVTPAVATLTRGIHVDRDLFVDALRRLGEGQLHDVLRHKQTESLLLTTHLFNRQQEARDSQH